MPAADLAAQRIVLGYSDQFLLLRARLRNYATLRWGALEDYRDAEILRFARAMDTAVTGSQAQVAALTDQYLATIGRLVTGDRFTPIGIDPRTVTDLAMRGVPAVDVYARTGPEVWTALSEGAQVSDAIGQGLDRALTALSTDLQLAKTHSSSQIVQSDDRITGYQRLAEGGNPCELCLIWEGTEQSTDELMAIHDNCACDVIPIYADGRSVDPSALRDRGELDPEQERGQPQIVEHGELGPVLIPEGQDLFIPRSDQTRQLAPGEF